jgi:hypothetical protein
MPGFHARRKKSWHNVLTPFSGEAKKIITFFMASKQNLIKQWPASSFIVILIIIGDF